MKKNITGGSVLSLLFLASVFVLALIKIDDTDAWVHLALGRLVWLNKWISFKDVYVYPDSGGLYHYSHAWLFSLIYYLASRAFDLYGVVLLKAVSILAAFYILLRDSLRPYRNHVVSAVVLSAVVIMVRHRFVERPDTMLMIFLSFSIFSLNAFVYENKKYLYLLPFMHMIWANMHPSIVLMFVPFTAFIAGGAMQGYLGRRFKGLTAAPSARQLVVMSAVFAASFAFTFISPDLFIQHAPTTLSKYATGANVIGASWWKQEIMELRPPEWQVTKWPFLMTGAVLLSFAVNRRRTSLIDLLLALPFMALQFTAYRFIFLFGIVSGPVLARNISSFVESRSWTGFFSKKAVTAAAMLWVVLYSGLALARMEPVGDSTKAFGFGVNMHNGRMTVPEGALRYMDARGIYGRVFNVFGYGGYISWRDFPKRTVFVDPRGTISGDLLEKMMIAPTRADIFEGLSRKYGFDSCLLWYPDVPRELLDVGYDVDMGLSHPGWALVYWDDFSLVYLQKGGKYDEVVRRDQYRYVKPANGAYGLKFRISDPDYRANVIKELERNIRETGSAKAYELLGFVYSETRQFNEAVGAYRKALENPDAEKSGIYSGLAFAYYNLGLTGESISYCRKALALLKSPDVFYVLAMNYARKGELQEAKKYLEEALVVAPDQPYIYTMLIDVCRRLGMRQQAEKVLADYERLKLRQEAESHFREGLKAYTGGDFGGAAREYELAVRTDPGNPALLSNLGYVYMDMGDYDKALQYQGRAVELYPDFANAHYGLALIYMKRGRPEMAKKQWEEYLRIEPKGYYARRAAAELRKMAGGAAK